MNSLYNKNTIPAIKVVFIGDSGTGKSSLIIRKLKNKFEETQSTIGAGYNQLKVNNLVLNLWDTAGQERFKSLIPIFFRGGDMFIIVYDITNVYSFNNIQYWIDEINKHSVNPLIMIVGNKLDLEPNYKVPEFDHPILLVSAKTGYNVDGIFESISCIFSDKIQHLEKRSLNGTLLNLDQKSESKMVDWLNPYKYNKCW